MKLIYIKPETELIACRLMAVITASTNTEWHTGTDAQGDDNPVGPDQPDPNQDSKQYFGFQETWE